MDNDTRLEIYSYLKKFLSQKEKHKDYIDYYEVYGLSENMTVEEIKRDLKAKNINEIFSSEQINYLEEGYKKSFKEVLYEVEKSFKVFETEASKSVYDKELKENKTRNYREKKSKKMNLITITKEDEKNLFDSLEITTTKHGIYHGFIALTKAIKGDFSNITNDNNARVIMQKLGKEKIKNIIYNNRNNEIEDQEDNMTMDYFTKFISKTVLRKKVNSFYKVCIETIKKYDLNGTKGQLETALNKYLMEHNPDSFTNDDNARDIFTNSNFSKNDIKILMYMRLNSLNDNRYKFSSIKNYHDSELVSIFSDVIINQVSNLN